MWRGLSKTSNFYFPYFGSSKSKLNYYSAWYYRLLLCPILFFFRVCYSHLTLAWPHFCRTQLHSPPNGVFAQEFEPASYFCDWTCVHLGMRWQTSPQFDFQSQFSMSKISFIILIFVSVKIIRLGVQLIIYQFLITSFFEVVHFLKLGPIFVTS